MVNDKLDTDEIYEELKRRIVKLEYQPGEILNEVELAEEFNMSRTPIRRIFQLLMTDKLLNVIPRYGAQVVPMDFKYMKSVFEVTRELDPFATRLAVTRISSENLKTLEEIISRMNNYDIKTDYQAAINDDERFHQIIIESTNNPCLYDILKGLHYHTERLWHYSEKHFDSINLFSDSLGKIVDAIKNKNEKEAELYAREHIDQFVNKIKSELL